MHVCKNKPVSDSITLISFSDDHDTTVLSWAVGQSRGNGLQVSGDTVTVVTEGTYFIYSQVGSVWYCYYCAIKTQTVTWSSPQVLYKDPTWVMGHVITKKFKGAESKLMKCLKSMPGNVSQPLNTCYTAGEICSNNHICIVTHIMSKI